MPPADARRLVQAPLDREGPLRAPLGKTHLGRLNVCEGENWGLVVAEIELESEDGSSSTTPDWAGEEVTEDPRYFNSNLVAKPYRAW